MEPIIVGNKVKRLMEKNNITLKEMSEKMGITSKTLSKKLKGEQEFCVSEIMVITNFFGLSIDSCAEIFFSSENDDSLKISNS